MSCDNIGSHVPPSFTPDFKEDPYHIPGYQGFVPQFKYRSEGKTFSNTTKSLFENPCIASSGKLNLADIHREDGGAIIKPGFECQVWEAESKRCREIQQRCLPGCYPKPPGQFPQPYLNSLQPANIAYEDRNLSDRCGGGGGGGAPRPPAASFHVLPHPLAAVREKPEGSGSLWTIQPPNRRVNNSQSNLKKTIQQQFLICPEQTVYDPKTNSRYFMFSQQNSRDCGQISPRPMPKGNCVSMASCKEICPCPQTQLKIRQLYPECGGLMSGYGGHVPGLNDCSIGDNYKKATAKVLSQVVGGKREYPGPWTLKLPDCKKRQRSRSSCYSTLRN